MAHDEATPGAKSEGVIRALERAGFVVSRTSGSHCRLIHVDDRRRKMTVPVHNRDLPHGTVHAIIAQAGLTVDQFADLL